MQPPPKPTRFGRRADSLSHPASAKVQSSGIGRSHTVPHRLSDQDSNQNEIVVDTLFENQRGCYIYGGEPSFKAENLMPTDSPAWCDGNGHAQVERMMYPTPHNWEVGVSYTIGQIGL
ncbi:hypothetical protein HDU67_002186 [Dinochytrium kinnereticum]|nr:hypothetical protein HDU67_002186 [Dinochytrium kinnereticum]